MLVIHRSDCPAECRMPTNPVEPAPRCFAGHESHACACSAPTEAQLRELVEAASYLLTDNGPSYEAELSRLDAALVPFREKK